MLSFLIPLIFIALKLLGIAFAFLLVVLISHLLCTLLCYHTLLLPIILALVSFYSFNSHLYTTTNVAIPQLPGYVVVLLLVCLIYPAYTTFTEPNSSSSPISQVTSNFVTLLPHLLDITNNT